MLYYRLDIDDIVVVQTLVIVQRRVGVQRTSGTRRHIGRRGELRGPEFNGFTRLDALTESLVDGEFEFGHAIWIPVVISGTAVVVVIATCTSGGLLAGFLACFTHGFRRRRRLGFGRWLGLLSWPVLVVGELLHMQETKPLGLLHKRRLLRFVEQLPAFPKTFGDLGVVHIGSFLHDSSPLDLRPHHKGIHRSLHVSVISFPIGLANVFGNVQGGMVEIRGRCGGDTADAAGRSWAWYLVVHHGQTGWHLLRYHYIKHGEEIVLLLNTQVKLDENVRNNFHKLELISSSSKIV